MPVKVEKVTERYDD